MNIVDLKSSEKAILIAQEYNIGKGSIKDLCEKYLVSDKTFQRQCKQLDIKRVDNRYIIPKGVNEIKGQTDLLEQDKEKGESMETIKQVTKTKHENNKAGKTNKTDNMLKGTKKKTFEIDILTDIAVKVVAGMQQVPQNEYVNKVLIDSIPDEILKMIKDGGIK